MRYKALACLIFSGCLGEIKIEEYKKIAHRHVLGQNNFLWDTQEITKIIINAPDKPKLKDLKTQILLINTPVQEILENIPQEKQVNFTLKTFEKPSFYSLVPNKKELIPGTYYGVYAQEKHSPAWELKYVFFINFPQAQLISHDIEEKVPNNRIIFSFKFDQAIKILNDQAVKLEGESAPEISSLNLSPDANTLVVRLEKNQELKKLSEGENYSFVFDKLLNIEPIEFVATKAQENLAIIKEPIFDPSSENVEIIWHLNNNFSGELYFGEDLSGIYNCINQSCPRIVKSDKSFIARYFLSGLKANKSYFYIFRAEDNQGHILISSGVFKTRAKLDLRFSEIFINPQIKPEAKAEFIEFFYAGLEAKKFENLKLVLENQECVLASAENPIKLKPKEYLLIVGQDFDDIGVKIPKNAVIVRLANKKLCGGLANQKPKNIKLVDEKGIVDRYGGHRWPTPKGVSVLRRELWGLDEFDNYCYSDTARGPTPGGPN